MKCDTIREPSKLSVRKKRLRAALNDRYRDNVLMGLQVYVRLPRAIVHRGYINNTYSLSNQWIFPIIRIIKHGVPDNYHIDCLWFDIH